MFNNCIKDTYSAINTSTSPGTFVDKSREEILAPTN